MGTSENSSNTKGPVTDRYPETLLHCRRLIEGLFGASVFQLCLGFVRPFHPCGGSNTPRVKTTGDCPLSSLKDGGGGGESD